METVARRSLQLLLAVLATLVALAAADLAGAQTLPSIDAIPGMHCAYDASVGEDWCALPVAPGVDLDAPRSAWLPVPDGFFIDFGEKQLEGRFCPGSLLQGRLCLDTVRGTLQSAGLNISDVNTVDAALQTLRSANDSATGRNELMQVANSLASLQVEEMAKVRQLLALEINARNVWATSQTNSDAAGEAALEQFIGTPASAVDPRSQPGFSNF